MGTIVAAGVLVLMVGIIIHSLVKGKKQGKSSCSGNCSHCKGCH